MKIDNQGQIVIEANDYSVKAIQILAKKRSGKSYAASKIAEELLTENIPIVIVDPVSAYWGLKEKFKIIIFGNSEQSDIPLVETTKEQIIKQAEIIARFLSTSLHSAIIDLNGWSEYHQQIFGHIFFKTIYQQNQNRRHVIVEEADIFAPQQIPKGETYAMYCRHALDNLVRRGGPKGLGTTIITQRPALVSKNILSQSDLTIALNIQASADMKAFYDIIKDDDELANGDYEKIKSEIKKAGKGYAYFYSPQWLGLKKFAQIGTKQTYHAGATLGDADYRPVSAVTLQDTIELDEVKSMLSEFSVEDKEDTHKQDQRKHDYSKLIAQYEEEIENMNNRMKELTTENSGLKQELKEHIDFKEGMRNYLIGKFEPAATIVTGDTKLETDLASTIVHENNIVRQFDESSLEGRLIWLLSKGHFNTVKEMKEIHILIDTIWGCAASEKPGKSNAQRFIRKLKDSLDLISKRPYSYLKEDEYGHSCYVKSDDADKRISIEK